MNPSSRGARYTLIQGDPAQCPSLVPCLGDNAVLGNLPSHRQGELVDEGIEMQVQDQRGRWRHTRWKGKVEGLHWLQLGLQGQDQDGERRMQKILVGSSEPGRRGDAPLEIHASHPYHPS